MFLMYFFSFLTYWFIKLAFINFGDSLISENLLDGPESVRGVVNKDRRSVGMSFEGVDFG